MALKHAILALLEHQDLTGYEIKESFDGPLELMWSASFGGIYPALHKMKLEKLVTEEFIVQHGKPNKIVYRLTATGREELKRWFSKPPLPESIKDEFLLKMYLMPESDPMVIETLLAERKERSEEKISFFKEKKGVMKKKNYFVDYNLHRYKAELHWITDVLNSIRKKTNALYKQKTNA